LEFSWDADNLTDLESYTNIEVYAVGQTDGADTVEFGGAEWRPSIVAGTGYTYADSGETLVNLPTYYRSEDLVQLAEFYYPTTEMTSAGTNTVFVDLLPDSTFSGTIDVGRIMAGPRLEYTLNMDWGWTVSWTDPSTAQTSVGGQEWPDLPQRYRNVLFSMSHMTEAEAFQHFAERLQRTRGRHQPFLFVGDPTNTDREFDWTVYCRLDGSSGPSTHFHELWGGSIKLKEVI
jgi:hypothetical protein